MSRDEASTYRRIGILADQAVPLAGRGGSGSNTVAPQCADPYNPLTLIHWHASCITLNRLAEALEIGVYMLFSQIRPLSPNVPHPPRQIIDPTPLILGCCRLAYGEIHRDFHGHPLVASEVQSCLDNCTLLETQTESCLLAPGAQVGHVLELSAEGADRTSCSGPFRGHLAHRSHFYVLATKTGQAASLCVKGDYHCPAPVVFEHYLNQKLVPGGLGLRGAIGEFDNALTLHQLARETQQTELLGPLPIRVVELQGYLSRQGARTSILDFLCSTQYFGSDSLQQEQHKRIEQLLAQENIQAPAQYLYILPGGINLRVSELFELTLSDHRSTKELGVLMADPCLDLLRHQGFTAISILRSAYGYLAQQYGFNLSDFAQPSEGRADPEDARLSLRDSFKVPVWCQGRRLPLRDLILNSFIDRIVTTAALAHTRGYIFNDPRTGLAGSLTARNVTLQGTVLDLESMFPNFRWAADPICKDLNDLLVSVAFLRRLLFRAPPSRLFDRIRGLYLERAKQFGADKQVLTLLEAASKYSSLAGFRVCAGL